MGMQTLPLRPDWQTNPNARDAGLVAVWMLWPDDQVQRDKAAHSFDIELAIRNPDMPSSETATEAGIFVDLVRAIPSIEAQYGEEIRNGFLRGMISGAILLRSVRDAGQCAQVTLATYKAEIAERFCALDSSEHGPVDGVTRRMSVKTIDNDVWPRFRSVSHLWAAYLSAEYGIGQNVIPCQPERLSQFLARADLLRMRGESIRPRNSGPVLRRYEAVRIPAGR